MLLAFTAPVAAQSIRQIGKSGKGTVEVLSFLPSSRCKTCVEMTKTVRTILEDDFTAAYKAGRVVLRIINIDDPANDALMRQFEVSGSALFVYDGKSGQAVDLTEMAFINELNNQTMLREEIRAHIESALE